MRTPRPPFLAGLVLFLATAAGAWPWGKPLTKEEVVAGGLKRYQEVHDDFAKKYPDNPEWLVQLDTARNYFRDQSDGYLKQNLPYRQDELRRLKKVIDEQIRGEQATIEVYRQAQRKGWNAEETATRVGVVRQTAALKIQTAAMPELPAGETGTKPVGQEVVGTASDSGDGGRPQGSNPDGRHFSGVFQPGRIEAASLVVNLGLASVACAQHADKCAPPKPLPPIPGNPLPENPTNPGGVAPTPVVPSQPLPSDPGQNGEEPPVPIVLPPNWHQDAAATATGPGATSGMITGGALAADRGDYALALSLARAALSSDPGNKDAMGLLYSVQGRTAGSAATAAGVGAANAGAAALAPSAYDPGGVGGGGAASAPSASFVSPGASRLITEQAVSGVKNAMKLGDAQSALEIVNKALSQDPNNPSLLNLRSQTYGYLGRWEEALKDASAGLAITAAAGKGEPLALLNSLARAQNRTRRYGDALATSERMLAADPRSAWAFANRAYARGGLGDKAAMMADIETAARLDPAFQRAAAEAAALTLPSDSDVLFLFPGEGGARPAKAPAPGGRGKSFGVVVGAGLVGGLLLALGLLSTVLAPLKDTVVSVFTKAKRTGPATTQAVATAQPASVAGNAGGLIRGQYEISRQIGQGGMGTVYEGTDRSLGRRVAIKKMRDELRVNARERDRFIIEAKTVASLHHPNIVDIYAIAEEGEDVYLVFEYVDGKTVHDLVQSKGRLDAAEAVRATRAMGEALTYAHAHGVIHRDMKPSNVMLTSAGQIKVMDFGIARMAKDALTRYSMTNTVVGTPPYMAPEQEQGVVRRESDVYSLAVCAYEMLTGKMPFIGIGAGMLMNKINMSYIPPSRAIVGLPESLDEVFLKAFQADPDRRHRTPKEFTDALEASLGGARSRAG